MFSPAPRERIGEFLQTEFQKPFVLSEELASLPLDAPVGAEDIPPISVPLHLFGEDIPLASNRVNISFSISLFHLRFVAMMYS